MDESVDKGKRPCFYTNLSSDSLVGSRQPHKRIDIHGYESAYY